MSWQALGWAWQQAGMDPESKLLLVALADKANEDGVCWPTQKRLALDCCVSERTIRDRLHKQLLPGGYVTVVRDRDSEGRLGRYTYQLQITQRQDAAGGVASGNEVPVDQRQPVAAQEVQPPEVQPPRAVSSTQRRAAPSTDQLGLAGMPEPVAKPPRPPRLDPIRDVFLEAFGACRNESEHGRRNRACFLVRQALTHDGAALPADGGAAELRRRIGVAQAEWGKRGIYVTDIGVANQWSLLGRMLTEGSGRLTAEQIFQQAVDEGLQL